MIISNWREVLRKAWSARLMICAALMSGVEIALPLFSDKFPRGVFAALSFVAVAGAFIARFVAQKDINGK